MQELLAKFAGYLVPALHFIVVPQSIQDENLLRRIPQLLD